MSESATRLLLTGLSLGAALLIGAFLIALAQRWWRKTESPRFSPSDQLAHFRSLYERGAMSKEEFEQLRSLLLEQIRQETMAPAAGAAAGTTPSPPAGSISPVRPAGARPDTPPPTGPTPPPELPPERPPEPPTGIQPG